MATSDGTLSQDEIDALLGGGSSSGGEPDINKLQRLLNECIAAQSASLSGAMEGDITISPPTLSQGDSQTISAGLADKLVVFPGDYQGDVSGKRYLIFTEDDAVKLAGLMIGQETVELNDTALSALGEAVSMFTSSVVTHLHAAKELSFEPVPAQGEIISKADLQLPSGELFTFTYEFQITGNGSFSMVELYDADLVADITADKNSAAAGGPFGGGGSNMGSSSVEAMQRNIKGVEFPNFRNGMSESEQKNISLLMDVSMEISVELGRTRWQIKDILSIGEGTIIELDKLAGEPVDVLVNRNLIARGEVVVIDESFGVRVTEIVSAIDRINRDKVV